MPVFGVVARQRLQEITLKLHVSPFRPYFSTIFGFCFASLLSLHRLLFRRCSSLSWLLLTFFFPPVFFWTSSFLLWWMRTRTTDYSILDLPSSPTAGSPMLNITNPYSGAIDLATATGVKLYNSAVTGPTDTSLLYDYSKEYVRSFVKKAVKASVKFSWGKAFALIPDSTGTKRCLLTKYVRLTLADVVADANRRWIVTDPASDKIETATNKVSKEFFDERIGSGIT